MLGLVTMPGSGKRENQEKNQIKPIEHASWNAINAIYVTFSGFRCLLKVKIWTILLHDGGSARARGRQRGSGPHASHNKHRRVSARETAFVIRSHYSVFFRFDQITGHAVPSACLVRCSGFFKQTHNKQYLFIDPCHTHTHTHTCTYGRHLRCAHAAHDALLDYGQSHQVAWCDRAEYVEKWRYLIHWPLIFNKRRVYYVQWIDVRYAFYEIRPVLILSTDMLQLLLIECYPFIVFVRFRFIVHDTLTSTAMSRCK